MRPVKALLFDGRDARLRDVPEPKAGDGMAVVRTRLAGICNTDLEITKGYMGFEGVLGHEMVGVVEEGPADWQGKRVVSEINFACGQCGDCDRGLGRHCRARTVMGILGANGTMAPYVAVPVRNLHEVPSSLTDEQAVFAEPLSAAFEILEQVHVTPQTECLVLGDGKLGLLIASVLLSTGARVSLSGGHPAHLAWLAERGAATYAKGQLPDRTYDLCVDATGSKDGFAEALARTRPRGTLVLKSTVADNANLSLAPIVIHEITVVGSRCGSFPPALRALEQHAIDTSPMVAARYPLADAEAALARAAERGTLKVLLTME